MVQSLKTQNEPVDSKTVYTRTAGEKRDSFGTEHSRLARSGFTRLEPSLRIGVGFSGRVGVLVGHMNVGWPIYAFEETSWDLLETARHHRHDRADYFQGNFPVKSRSINYKHSNAKSIWIIALVWIQEVKKNME